MPKFLIDVNLPYYFSLWNTPEYIHQQDINDAWNDELIWEYAMNNNLTIVTKDSDFSSRILFHSPPPRVTHIKFGNLKMSEFFNRITSWIDVQVLSEGNKLVQVYQDRIEAIN
jgi:predicted nuclease of predicted toxin-antitoxin system